MSEIQYCEDCEHILLDKSNGDLETQLNLAQCGLSGKITRDAMVARIFYDRIVYDFCITARSHFGDSETCPKFEAKDAG